jgi:hypothetical protein
METIQPPVYNSRGGRFVKAIGTYTWSLISFRDLLPSPKYMISFYQCSQYLHFSFHEIMPRWLLVLFRKITSGLTNKVCEEEYILYVQGIVIIQNV